MSQLNYDFDTHMHSCFARNPALSALLATMVDGGRIVHDSAEIGQWLGELGPQALLQAMLGDSLEAISRLGLKDLIVTQNDSEEYLISLGKATSASVLCVTEKTLDPVLAEFAVTIQQLKEAIKQFPQDWQMIQPLLGKVRSTGEPRRPGLFLDRDGVVLEFVDYLKTPDQVKLMAGIERVLAAAHAKGYAVVLVTNQSGIGRQYYSWSEYDASTLHMQKLLAEKGQWVDRIMTAPYIAGSQRHYGLMRRSLRKPRAGMIHASIEDLGIDLSRSIMVGDFATDLMTACLAGIPNIFMLKGETFDREMKKWESWPLRQKLSAQKSIKVIDDLSELKL